uniref:Uncharacterized protein n=2 Tax=Corethron hystrix TaxID=216773 RepID=A0A7S1FQX7_9STRA|mmetsp:Transcript_20709/g.46986  ORF Transcript_20709/g.46986 Transcript_20709/m.46986 type:complete len:109 (+) Transcript_20709:114-440(+)
MADSAVKISMFKEHAFSTAKPDVDVWDGESWRTASPHGNGTVCQIEVYGIFIVAVTSPSPTAARNRACAFAVTILTERKEMVELLQQVRLRMGGGGDRKYNGEEEEEE